MGGIQHWGGNSSCKRATLHLILTLIPRHLRPAAQVCVCAVDFGSSAGVRVRVRVRVVVACNWAVFSVEAATQAVSGLPYT